MSKGNLIVKHGTEALSKLVLRPNQASSILASTLFNVPAGSEALP